MGGHALTPPTDRRLGRPLPYQLPNQTHAYLQAPQLYYTGQVVVVSYGVLIPVSRGYAPLGGKLRTRYSPVRRSRATEIALPLDLHVLSLPLAFILSQDQTLHGQVL